MRKSPHLEREISCLRRDCNTLEVNVLKKMSVIYDLKASLRSQIEGEH